MSVKTLTEPLYTSASTCLFLALFLISCMSICGNTLIESVDSSRDESTTYPETNTPQGPIRGMNMVTHHNRTVFGFLGIPYAQPPVGDLRFKGPVAAEAWNGILEATSDSEPCPQFVNQKEIKGNEDCLYLNVYTPELPASDNSTLLPVMVWILGGAFRTGNITRERFGPDFLLDKDVVLVVPSFRMGVLGYLSTGDEVSPGNYALKDIVRALEWTQDSIESFGGDPNRVTLFGGSTGAMSVHFVALSKLTEGLFHRYITQSGTALSIIPCKPGVACPNRAIQLGEYLGCPTNTSTLLVNCLRNFNASQLVNAITIFYIWHGYPSNIWIPTIEPDIEGALLTDTPTALYAAGKIRDLPWIASVTRDEGLINTLVFYEDPDLFEDFLDKIDLVLPYMLEYQYVVDDVTAHTTAIKSFYLNDLTANRSILLTNLTKLFSDALFIYSVYDAFQQQLLFAESPQYLCSFEYCGTYSHSYFITRSTKYMNAVHGDEVMYLFQNREFSFAPADAVYNEADWVMVDTMVQLWTSFATNGIPTTEDTVSTTTWEPYSSLENYLRIGNQFDTALEMKYDLLSERMRFWDQLTKSTITSGGVRNSLQILSIALCLYLLSYTS